MTSFQSVQSGARAESSRAGSAVGEEESCNLTNFSSPSFRAQFSRSSVPAHSAPNLEREMAELHFGTIPLLAFLPFRRLPATLLDSTSCCDDRKAEKEMIFFFLRRCKFVLSLVLNENGANDELRGAHASPASPPPPRPLLAAVPHPDAHPVDINSPRPFRLARPPRARPDRLRENTRLRHSDRPRDPPAPGAGRERRDESVNFSTDAGIG